MFSAYQQIKADLKELPIEVNTKFIKYYQTNFVYNELYCDKIYQVDIVSCYANILFNKGLLSKETFKYLQQIKKEDRLASVGMLASRKNIFEFDGKGNIIHSINKNPKSDYFFYCVQETFKIMNECKEILKEHFLFSWVDAIYFTGGKPIADKVINFFKQEHNLFSTFNVFKEFEVELRGDYYRLRYMKDGEPTFMNIPTPEQHEKRELINYMLNKKFENWKGNKSSTLFNHYVNKTK